VAVALIDPAGAEILDGRQLVCVELHESLEKGGVLAVFSGCRGGWFFPFDSTGCCCRHGGVVRETIFVVDEGWGCRLATDRIKSHTLDLVHVAGVKVVNVVVVVVAIVVVIVIFLHG
jgi:hypothetical protein